MSAKLWCQFGDGRERENFYGTEEGARQELKRALEHHRDKGHDVSEQYMENQEPVYIARNAYGRLMRKYQVILVTSEVS